MMNILRNKSMLAYLLLASIVVNCLSAYMTFKLWRVVRSEKLNSRIFENNYYLYKRKYEYWLDKDLFRLEQEADIIFFGDSITQMFPLHDYIAFWKYDTKTNLVNRGISGNTTEQMLERFERDVLKLEPKIVVIFGGVCDFHYEGDSVDEATRNLKNDIALREAISNLDKMLTLAVENEIKPIICTILPFFKSENRLYKNHLLKLNNWIRNQKDALVVDYFAAFADKEGYLKGKMLYSIDGTHPTQEGYQLMAQTLKETLIKLNSSLK